jgi:hypothetical protein
MPKRVSIRRARQPDAETGADPAVAGSDVSLARAEKVANAVITGVIVPEEALGALVALGVPAAVAENVLAAAASPCEVRKKRRSPSGNSAGLSPPTTS